MTKDEALRLALEALEYPLNQSHENFNVDMAELLSHRAITAIKEALAQPPEERNFCPRCGKRAGKNAWDVHTCSLPEQEPSRECTTEAEKKAFAFGWWKAMEAQRLAQPKQKAVAVFDEKLGRPNMLANAPMLTHGQKLYTTPPQRTWVGLTDEEKNAITWGNDIYKILELAEAKLKEKNT